MLPSISEPGIDSTLCVLLGTGQIHNRSRDSVFIRILVAILTFEFLFATQSEPSLSLDENLAFARHISLKFR